MQIIVPSIPGRLRISDALAEDALVDPAVGANVLFNETMDEFQSSALKTTWWVPDVIDSSGFGTGKSRRAFLFANLRCMLLPGQWIWIYYQTFEAGKQIFWPYYEEFNHRTAPLFAAQLGHVDADGDTDGKDNKKGPACYIQHFKNGNKIVMPAPGWFQSAKSSAGLTFNVALIDEWTKIETMKPEQNRDMVGGIDQQVVGRVRRGSFNQFHPLWCNHRLYTATAESPEHPSWKRVRMFEKEIAKGNPNYAIIRYDFKDFSNKKSHTGKPFKIQVPDWKTIGNHKKMFTRAHSLREDHGLWARETSGWYSEASLARCVTAGVAAGLEPEVARANTGDGRLKIGDRRLEMGDGVGIEAGQTYYFMGVDPAPAQTSRADDGAMVILRARSREGLGRAPTENVGDWETDYVWAYRVRGESKLFGQSDEALRGVFPAETARQWSGLVHYKHLAFGLAGIHLDPQGGGLLVLTDLNKTRQSILGVEREVTPISVLGDITTGNAHFILTLQRRTDEGIKALWPILQGDDSLVDAMHVTYQQAVEHGQLRWPKPFNERPREETEKWPVELQWALRNLDAARHQLMSIQVMTKDEGGWLLTRNMAKQFVAGGKKDLAYASIYAYVRFLVWLKLNELEFSGEGGGEEGVWVFGGKR